MNADLIGESGMPGSEHHVGRGAHRPINFSRLARTRPRPRLLVPRLPALGSLQLGHARRSGPRGATGKGLQAEVQDLWKSRGMAGQATGAGGQPCDEAISALGTLGDHDALLC